MRKRTLFTSVAAAGAALALGIAGTVAAQAEETGDEALADAIDAILADPRLTDSQAGVVVADANTGEVLYERNGDQRAVPASNTKLATSAAALEVLGEDYTFTTEAIGTTRPEDGVIDGDLYLRGTGDPTMLEADYDALAAELADAGVSTIDGDLVGDDTAFDDVRLGTEWGWSDLQYLYAAEVSALTVASGDDYNAGTVRVFVDPGAGEGDAAAITMVPGNDYVTIVNDTTTTAAGSGTSVSIDRDLHGNEIVVSGTIAADSGGTYGTRAVIDPAGLAASVFARALDDHGITLAGDVRTGETTPQGGEVLAAHHSMPLSELVVHFLKRSNSSHAEALFKALGYETTGEGTFASGKAAVYQGIEKYGVDTGPIRLVDGSGLSRHNLVTPTMITDLLVGAKDAPWFDTWYEALPIACEPGALVGGTLESRMCDTPAEGNVHGKTGSMTSVSALSGYVTDADGRELVFSVLINDYLYSTVKDVEDEVAATVAGYSEAATEAEMTTFAEVEERALPAEDANADLECSWVEPAVC
ncbi:D-alanyl-D-alanine carboxypeptidase/D-alanyl-D-alanine endopeptidase [Glycomyces arizonensis]|uniref:D-alanyl-D-alanine carboxypeptidase/D-alanyl-D-alanine endopeptidase n=1 Tax=Glycomyces arizonensis TaxID=256035 RepID=UPI0004080C31|nr:D-alanyl-D-alanine carboxypeptidase/D-alanyl-D-alanine-endopeptidase [Glycomyces arizonensis]